MNKLAKFSFNEYRKILELYSPICKDFKDIDSTTTDFCLIRHDVEFSLERALEIAKIDSSYGIKSSFFIQVLNDAYNPLSSVNSDLIKKIEEYGHFVGLHFYFSHLEEGNLKNLEDELKRQVNILQGCLKAKIDRFSYHRPSHWALEIDTYQFSNLINAYSQPYFEFVSEGTPKKVKYIADSNHTWKYSHPLETNNYKCFQLLIHPDEWSETGGSELENFKSIIEDANIKFINNVNLEYKTFEAIKKFF